MHWTILHRYDDKLLYFNSFGITPNIIKRYAENNNLSLYTQNQVIQHLNSTLCGFYVLYMAESSSYQDYLYRLSRLSENTEKNILIIMGLV